MKFNERFLAHMREATQLLQSEGPMAATAAIQRALHGVTDASGSEQQADRTASMPQVPELHDIFARAHQADTQPASDTPARFSDRGRRKWTGVSTHQAVEDVEAIDVPKAGEDVARTGRFISASCTNHAGTRGYKLYIPSGYKDEALPLVVMLHGCTQNPDDFAAGTGMNTLAEEYNCFVAYPAQAKAANGTHCWNWFQPGDQRRGHGEPSILADITREIARTYKVDTSRIYVAGLSAGGAMAAVMAATYPELYAAVGIHSGLPYGIAHDAASAFAAMKRRKPKAAMAKTHLTALVPPVPLRKAVPAIVFHGDRDTTVHPLNGDQVLAQCVPAASEKDARIVVEEGRSPNGRPYTRTIVQNGQGGTIAEKWFVHGAGHAWSGGSRNGSYTDPEGPSAAREMLRFFYEQRNAPQQ
jgi:poly(hydroxyalkanoate) depolymerase family esterase